MKINISEQNIEGGGVLIYSLNERQIVWILEWAGGLHLIIVLWVFSTSVNMCRWFNARITWIG